ncbi:MAG: hypothetical protein K2K24_02565 [Clostridia bacterium]|nr:hypothetical protein [Clostridia bacterium]
MIVNILKVCEVGNLVSYHHSQDILATAIMGVVIVVLSLAVFLCGISFKDKHITYILGFLVSKIRYEDVVAIRQDTAGKFLLIYYKSAGKGLVKDTKTGISADVINVTCDSRYFDEIIAKIKEKNSDAIIELVTVKPKDKKESK